MKGKFTRVSTQGRKTNCLQLPRELLLGTADEKKTLSRQLRQVLKKKSFFIGNVF